MQVLECTFHDIFPNKDFQEVKKIEKWKYYPEGNYVYSELDGRTKVICNELYPGTGKLISNANEMHQCLIISSKHLRTLGVAIERIDNLLKELK